MIIRKALPSDAATIVSFQLAMALETENIVLDPDVVDLGVNAVFDDYSKGSYYVAERSGTIMGSLLTTYEWSDWRNGTVLWIQSVYVLPEFRRQGVYRKLYSYLQEMVQTDDQLKGIRLYADISNKTAHRAYQQLGMESDHYQTFEWLKEW